MIRKFDGFIAEAMCYKDIDRSKVSTRDIILNDGRAYDVYQDPWKIATQKMWQDMQDYELRGDGLHSHDALKARIQAL